MGYWFRKIKTNHKIRKPQQLYGCSGSGEELDFTTLGSMTVMVMLSGGPGPSPA
jgi:hypothetical protein